MKKFFTLIIVFMACASTMTAKASDEKSTPKPIVLDLHQNDGELNPIIHRAPMRVYVEAWYDSITKTISILYLGDAIGEANLHKDGQLIDSASEINTTFLIEGAGLYTIEIITDLWSASGNIEI